MRPIEVDAVRAARGGFSIPPEDEQELTRLRKVDRLAPSEQALHWAFVTPAVAILVLIKFGAWALISAFGFLGFIALAVFGVISSIIASSLSAPKDRQ
ncbi:MAG: hypothetical protein JNM76_09620 [Betaproteobacteria bacterium]|nr:hypothetical protein [Betaproteobacteria bacterium]